MFIFANTFELVCVLDLPIQDAFPLLQILRVLVTNIPKSLFDLERPFVDDYYLSVILRSQLAALFELKTTLKLFALVFGQSS
jgi:hypothetical protein